MMVWEPLSQARWEVERRCTRHCGFFAEKGHPVFRCSIRFLTAMLKSTGGGRLSTHFNADPSFAEFMLKTIVAVNKLSISGAVAK